MPLPRFAHAAERAADAWQICTLSMPAARQKSALRYYAYARRRCCAFQSLFARLIAFTPCCCHADMLYAMLDDIAYASTAPAATCRHSWLFRFARSPRAGAAYYAILRR